MASVVPVIEFRGVSKRFGNVLANDRIDLALYGGVHAIVGENGAGKSTLMKILAGVHAPDAGSIYLKGGDKEEAKPITRFSPKAAIEAGIGMVHQHFMLVGNLSVLENVILGREKRRGLWLDTKKAAEEIKDLAVKYKLDVPLERRVDDLSVGEKQRVEILKVLYRGARYFIFDEPTAVLSPPEVEGFFQIIAALKKTSPVIILITHKLDEVMAVSDRVTVMRAGRVVETVKASETSPKDLAYKMVGREVALGGKPSGESAARKKEGAKEGLVVKNLKVRDGLNNLALDGISFEVAPGEIVGIAGVEGNGQSELALSLAGVLPAESGQIFLAGKEITQLTPRARKEAGISHIPEDRHLRGLVLEMSLEENLILGEEVRFSRAFGFLAKTEIRKRAEALAEEFDIRPREPFLPSGGLSGGNQQKIVVARELSRTFSFLIAAQPTRGVDVGAIEFIHARLRKARDEGKAVLLISADLDEVLALSDRLFVLYRGKLVGESAAREAKREQLGSLMAGVGA